LFILPVLSLSVNIQEVAARLNTLTVFKKCGPVRVMYLNSVDKYDTINTATKKTILMNS